MARPRGKPKTSFGAWLDSWLSEHPGYTLAAFGDEVGVTKSAVSLWLSGDTARIPIDRLRKIALVTGEPVENLEQMVYGRRPPGDPGALGGPDLLDAIADRVRTVLREERGSYTEDMPAAGPPDAKTIRERRRYWLQRAQVRLKLTNQPDRLRLLGWPTTRRARLSAIENGSADLEPHEIRDLARAYRIPERVLTDPPPTDDERMDQWHEIALMEITPEPTPARRERRRAS